MTTRLHQLHADGPDSDVLGDCWRTALACILDQGHPTDVAHVVELHRHDPPESVEWWAASVAEVERLAPGMTLRCLMPTFPVYVGTPLGDVVATGPSPRGGFLHAVVVSAIDGSLVWDPHPDGTGLAGPPVEVAALDRRDEP